MSIIFQVLKDLVGMFMADARMTLAVLALVATSAALARFEVFDLVTVGWLLLAGCVVLLLASVSAAARK
ncbi:MAG: hypothetical protein GXP03_13020 [Alphaproteobacteria bacterium]|nr:hypothetical protein [Alphaproteobacteria bacterium]